MGKKNAATMQEKLDTIKKADASVKAMKDFTSPEVLYQEIGRAHV